MRRDALWSAALLLGAALCTACGSDDDSLPQPSEAVAAPAEEGAAQETWTMRVGGERSGQTKALTLDGEGNLVSSWARGEKVYVCRQEGSAMHPVGTLSAAADGDVSELTGSLTGSFKTGDKLWLYTCPIAFAYSGQDGTLEGIASRFDPMEADAVITVDEEKREISASAVFQPLHAVCRFVFEDGDRNSLSVSHLSITADRLVNSYNGNYEPVCNDEALTVTPATPAAALYVSMADTEPDGDARVTYTFTATVGDKIYEGTKTANLKNGAFNRAVRVTLIPKS